MTVIKKIKTKVLLQSHKITQPGDKILAKGGKYERVKFMNLKLEKKKTD
jgi:hypothetical protein